VQAMKRIEGKGGRSDGGNCGVIGQLHAWTILPTWNEFNYTLIKRLGET
jgi:hypothetical protein